MAGVLPFETEVCGSPQGHGYVDLVVDRPNPFYQVGTSIRGHEFHFSRIVPTNDLPPTACAVRRGTGSFDGRDSILVKNVWASYAHNHALATREWGNGIIAAARRFSNAGGNSGRHSLHDVGALSVAR
jgi:cobyrinic acid a,c-diamide synthase